MGGRAWEDIKVLRTRTAALAVAPQPPPGEELLGRNQDVVTEKTGPGLSEKINKCNAVQM